NRLMNSNSPPPSVKRPLNVRPGIAGQPTSNPAHSERGGWGAGIRTPISWSRARRIAVIRPPSGPKRIATATSVQGPLPSGADGNMCSMEPQGGFRNETRREVAALLGAGMTRLEAARRLGLAKSTVSYHARRLGLPIDERCNRRYDWAEIQRFYDDGHSVTQCQAHFGFSRQTWNAARKRGAVVARPHAMPLEELLGAKRNRGHLKCRLIRLGLKEARCEVCGI